MRKILAMLFACSIVLAGCIDLIDEDVAEIVEELVDVAGCNDATAYNYDENATNSNACLTELVLRDSVTQFIHLVDEGPEWGETKGMVMEGSETDDDGETSEFTTTFAVSPDGMYTMIVLEMGIMNISMGELMTENSDGTTNFVVTWMGNTFQMNSAGIFSETWNEQNYLGDDDESDMDQNDVVIEGEDAGDDESGVDARAGHGDDMDDNDDDHDEDHGDEMGDDMDDDFDMDLPNTEVSIPENFDPATAMFELGLATANGYSFSTTLDDSMGHSVTMIFTLSLTFEVTKLVIEETDSNGMTSTSSIEILDADAVDILLTNDDTLMHHALPFTLSPVGGDDHGDHDGHDHGNDDLGDHDGNDHGDDDHDDHDWSPSETDMFSMIDSNNDGMLSLEEVLSIMHGGDGPPTPERAIAEGDADDSGGISWLEFVDYWNSYEDENDPTDQHLDNNEDLASEFYYAFNSSDNNEDGELTVDELQYFIDQVSSLSGNDDDEHYVFYCSNDGEQYANDMGGILCPEGAGEVPTCPDGEPCVCIDGDGSCTDGDDDWGYED
ncbi:MAG: EF-hand domain-containing protein, partial [Candidatus Thermoplasmatota archaeon]|nr:EF-hand domain-containing protein [Candidatus Thermoplasmatota archaeon]